MKLKPDTLVATSIYLSSIAGGDTKPAESLHDKVPKHSAMLTKHGYENLLTSTPEGNTRYDLGDALHKLDYQDPSPEEAQILIGIAIYDAERLLAEMLPPDVLDDLEITEDINPDRIPSRPDEDAVYVTPFLKDILLLANACDSTGDPKLHRALEYILDHAPGDIDDQLTRALAAAKQSDTPIMKEYHKIQADDHDETESTLGDEQTKKFIELMRKASVMPIGSLQREIRRGHDKKAPPEEGGTGYLAS